MLSQLVVIVVWLLNLISLNWNTLILWSLYSQSVVLINSFSLCLLRTFILKKPFWLGVAFVLLVSVFSVCFVEIVSQLAINGMQYFSLQWSRVLRLVLVALILCLLVIRFFLLLDKLDQRSKSEAQARIQALQLRIQPHFLFNSLNTISELTIEKPEKAEEAINSLAMLFRAGLENQRKYHTIKNEISLCEKYIELERWRFGDLLGVEWHISINEPSIWNIPKLILQPIIENAIVYGTQSNGVIDINVDIRETNNHISLKIKNKNGVEFSNTKGHGIALDNIRERLFVLYDDQFKLKIKKDEEEYTIIMRIPKTTYTEY